MEDVLAAINTYCDAAPRSAATAESIGSFTLFVNQASARPYYARPTLGATAFLDQDLLRVRERQRSLKVPQTLEWIAELVPEVRTAAEMAGFEVHEHPLLVLDPDERRHPLPPQDVTLRLLEPDDDLRLAGAVAALSFATPGTAVGSVSTKDLVEAAAQRSAEAILFEQERLRAGLTVCVAAFLHGIP